MTLNLVCKEDVKPAIIFNRTRNGQICKAEAEDLLNNEKDFEDEKIEILPESTELITLKELILHKRIVKDNVVLRDIVNQKKLDRAISILENGKIEKHDYDIFKLLTNKRKDILEKTGYLVPLEIMVEEAIKKGIKRLNEDTL